MKRVSESYLLSLARYKASKKTVNQLSKSILVGHKLNDACRYFVGKFYFLVFLATIRFWYTISKKYATSIWVQLICINYLYLDHNWSISIPHKGHHWKTCPRFAYPCFVLCPAFAQFLQNRIFTKLFYIKSYVLPVKSQNAWNYSLTTGFPSVKVCYYYVFSSGLVFTWSL